MQSLWISWICTQPAWRHMATRCCLGSRFKNRSQAERTACCLWPFVSVLVSTHWFVYQIVYWLNSHRFIRLQIIRERVSTATLLLIAHTGCSLKTVHVRRNAVVLRFDWPRCSEWTDEFWNWLRESARSYERTEVEVALALRRPSWSMLSDQAFKRIEVSVRRRPTR